MKTTMDLNQVEDKLSKINQSINELNSERDELIKSMNDLKSKNFQIKSNLKGRCYKNLSYYKGQGIGSSSQRFYTLSYIHIIDVDPINNFAKVISIDVRISPSTWLIKKDKDGNSILKYCGNSSLLSINPNKFDRSFSDPGMKAEFKNHDYFSLTDVLIEEDLSSLSKNFKTFKTCLESEFYRVLNLVNNHSSQLFNNFKMYLNEIEGPEEYASGGKLLFQNLNKLDKLYEVAEFLNSKGTNFMDFINDFHKEFLKNKQKG